MTIRRYSNVVPEEVRLHEEYLIAHGFRFVKNAREEDLLPKQYTKHECFTLNSSPYGPTRWNLIANDPD